MNIALKILLFRFLDIIPIRLFIRHTGQFFNKKNTSPAISLLRSYVSDRYKRGTDEEQRRLGLLLWQSPSATAWFQNRTFSKETVERFRAATLRSGAERICEIGTGNGALLYALSSATRGSFTGVDLSREQIAVNEERYSATSLRFIAADILEYLPLSAADFYFSYVSLTTFTPEMVRELFALLAKKSLAVTIAMYEPADNESMRADSSKIRGDLAYHHNYITIAKTAGFDILEETPDQSGFVFLVCRHETSQSL